MEYVKRKRKLVDQFSKSNILLTVQEREQRKERGGNFPEPIDIKP